jgi:ABC-type glycerol-3-phosphate transport system substrate-binding protein
VHNTLSNWRFAVYYLLAICFFVCSSTTAKQVELDYWFLWTDKAKVLEEALKGFHEQYPNIKVNVITGTANDANAIEKIMVAVVSGAAPDLVTVHGGHYSVLGMQGLLEPLDLLFEKYSTFSPAKDLAPGFDKLGIYNGVRYALPFWDTVPTYALLYNTAMWDRAGLPRLSRDYVPSWEEVAQYNKKLTIIDDNGVIKQLGYHPMNDTHRRSYTFETLWGAPLYADNYKPNINNPTLISALEKAKEYFVDPVPGILSFDWDGFLKNNTAMWLNAIPLNNIQNIPTQYKIDVEVTWAPHINQIKSQRWRAWGIAMPAGDPEDIPETLLLMEYLMTNQEAINLLWDRVGASTANLKFLRTKRMPELQRWLYNTLFEGENVVVEDMSPMKNYVNDAVEAAVAAVFRGQQSAQVALETRQQELMVRWSEIYNQ